jgi:hypothetical protein
VDDLSKGLAKLSSLRPGSHTTGWANSFGFLGSRKSWDGQPLVSSVRPNDATPEGERRYSPAEVVSTERVPVVGNLDPKRICTSIVERQNLTMRVQIRSLARLTNAFSKKWESLWAALRPVPPRGIECKAMTPEDRRLVAETAVEPGGYDNLMQLKESIAKRSGMNAVEVSQMLEELGGEGIIQIGRTEGSKDMQDPQEYWTTSKPRIFYEKGDNWPSDWK